MFYDYAYLREKDSDSDKARTPYYIGKGKVVLNAVKKEEHVILKGMIEEINTCQHCSKPGSKGAMQRWHSDKCKLKRIG